MATSPTETPAARRERLLQLRNTNPHVTAMLNVIAAAEGVQHGYHTGFGNTRIAHLRDHPRDLKAFRQTDGRRNLTSAAGRYQFLSRTWDDAARALDLKDFSPESQDLAALWAMERRGALDKVAEGDLRGAEPLLGKEWASLPSSKYKQPRRSQARFEELLRDAGYNPPEPPDATRTEGVIHPSYQIPQPGARREDSPRTLDRLDAWAADLQRLYTPDVPTEREQPAPLMPTLGAPEPSGAPNWADPSVPDDGFDDWLAQEVQTYVDQQQAAPSTLRETPGTPDALAALRRLQTDPLETLRDDSAGDADWTQRLLPQAVMAQADEDRQNAVAAFFGEAPVRQMPIPKSINDAIDRLLAG